MSMHCTIYKEHASILCCCCINIKCANAHNNNEINVLEKSLNLRALSSRHFIRCMHAALHCTAHSTLCSIQIHLFNNNNKRRRRIKKKRVNVERVRARALAHSLSNFLILISSLYTLHIRVVHYLLYIYVYVYNIYMIYDDDGEPTLYYIHNCIVAQVQ